MNKRILTILTALCLTGALAGCGTGNPGSVPASSQPAPETTVGTTAPPTTSPPTQPKAPRQGAQGVGIRRVQVHIPVLRQRCAVRRQLLL